MNPFGNLSDENKEQIIKYLTFLRSKKESITRSLGNDFEDSRSGLSEDVYSKSDVVDFTEFLESQTRNYVRNEISSLINMSALAINGLLEAAQEQNANIVLNTASLENQGLLDSIERMNLDTLTSNKKRNVGLVSLKDEAKALANESRAVREEAGRLEESNKQLQARFNTLQADATKLAREKAALQNELSDLRRHLEIAERNNQDFESSVKGGNDTLQRKIQRLEDELDEERETNQKRVAETPQFLQMKKMMQSQNEKIRELRRRLERYEPDNSKEEEDDD